METTTTLEHRKMDIDFTVFKGSAGKNILQSTSHRDLPTGNQVLVKITHSGICGTDEHYVGKDMVLGHEGVGTVQQMGEGVKGLKVGDLVGWGYTHKTCGVCDQCLIGSHILADQGAPTGQDQYCAERERYGVSNLDQGSFGSHAIWDASFLFKVPDGLAPEDAAPLMCGGATVFGVIESYNIRPTDRVGVVGVGGLGHLAIQFLAKIGAAVVVFSSTEEKRDEARGLGATEFYTTKGVKKLEIGKPLQHLLVTTSFLPDWKMFLDVMQPEGTIYPLTVSSGDLAIPVIPVVAQGLTVQGSSVASRAVHKKMLEFAARHGIRPIIERFPMTKSGVEEGMAKLRDGKMRYRGVLVVEASQASRTETADLATLTSIIDTHIPVSILGVTALLERSPCILNSRTDPKPVCVCVATAAVARYRPLNLIRTRTLTYGTRLLAGQKIALSTRAAS
ncbi:chaperonin 10-like protein [Mycena sp. CBHHK59/15]|nr:chaperonin 10-like protein [Mycena sp. CBHHK59/15]